MLCDNCHSSNAAGAKFCAVCGAPLPGEPLTHRQGQGESRQPQQHYSYEDGFNSTRRPPNAGRRYLLRSSRTAADMRLGTPMRPPIKGRSARSARSSSICSTVCWRSRA